MFTCYLFLLTANKPNTSPVVEGRVSAVKSVSHKQEDGDAVMVSQEELAESEPNTRSTTDKTR